MWQCQYVIVAGLTKVCQFQCVVVVAGLMKVCLCCCCMYYEGVSMSLCCCSSYKGVYVIMCCCCRSYEGVSVSLCYCRSDKGVSVSLCCCCRSHSGYDNSSMCCYHRWCLSHRNLQEEVGSVDTFYQLLLHLCSKLFFSFVLQLHVIYIMLSLNGRTLSSFAK